MRLRSLCKAVRFFTIQCALIPCVLLRSSAAQKAPDNVEWAGSYREARDLAIRTDKLLLLYVSSENSAECQRMESQALHDQRVTALSRQMVCVKINATKEDGQDIVKRYKITTLPSLLFILPGKSVVSWFEGYRPAIDMAAEMVHALMKQSEQPDFAQHQTVPEATWRVLLVIVRGTNVTTQENGQPITYRDYLSDQEIETARHSFFGLPELVARLTQRRIKIDAKCVILPATITKVSEDGPTIYSPSATDVYPLIERYDISGEWDTIAVFWKGSKIMHYFGLGGTLTPRGSTYLVVNEANPSSWRGGQLGEVFLHEWTHGVATYFRKLGYAERIPPKDADGGGMYGYKGTSYDGNCTYYLPLFNALVPFDGMLRGFDSEMWRQGAPRQRVHTAADKAFSPLCYIKSAELIDKSRVEIEAILGKPRSETTGDPQDQIYQLDADVAVDVVVSYMQGRGRRISIHFRATGLTYEQCLSRVGITPPTAGTHNNGNRNTTIIANGLFWNDLPKPFPFRRIAVLVGDSGKPPPDFENTKEYYSVSINLLSQSAVP